MEKYENIEVVGEGSYGVVMKCRHKETGQIVAIKKFLESVENIPVRKLAFREIRMLKRLRHENLVSLIEVFRRKKRFYLVFEYLDHTILDELEDTDGGLGFETSRRYIFQALRGLNFCHGHQIMHRDVKPENVLVSSRGVIKLCDFGFARNFGAPHETCTDYVATRWYRAPELLVGDTRYGKSVDTWAIGCLYVEMLNGAPLFPGESDIDQLYRITRLLGGLCGRHQSLLRRGGNNRAANLLLCRSSVDNSNRVNQQQQSADGVRSLRALIPSSSASCLDFVSQCLRMEPETRPSCAQLLQHALFVRDNFAEIFLQELKEHVTREADDNPLVMRLRSRNGNNNNNNNNNNNVSRDDDRRLSVLSLDRPSARLCSSVTRWQTNLQRESSMKLQTSHDRPSDAIATPPRADNPSTHPKLTATTMVNNNPTVLRHQQQQQQQQSRLTAQQLSRPRDDHHAITIPINVRRNESKVPRLLPCFESNGFGGNFSYVTTLTSRIGDKDRFTLPLLTAHKKQQPQRNVATKRTRLDIASHVA